MSRPSTDLKCWLQNVVWISFLGKTGKLQVGNMGKKFKGKRMVFLIVVSFNFKSFLMIAVGVGVQLSLDLLVFFQYIFFESLTRLFQK